MKPYLIFMSGLAFSGKTTIAKELSRLLKVPILSYDHDIYVTHRSEVPQGASAAEEFEIIQAIARKELARRLQVEGSLIYDDLCLDHEDRARIVRVAQDCDATPILIFVDTPMTTINERRRANIETSKRGHVTDEKLAFDASIQERPTPDEQPIIVAINDNARDIAKAILQRVDSRSA